MLYSFLKFPAKLAFYIWCRHLRINQKDLLNSRGPVLIAANHPNSFLDAILLSSIFKQPIYSLARGDAFKNKGISKMLHSLKMLPVYRVSEGVENLEHNYKTFDDCIEVFKNNGIVLIFSEGKCVNEWCLRPLKKGTARLAISAWQQGIPLKIIPLGINYNSFTSFGKNIQLNFGNDITSKNINSAGNDTYGTKVQLINNVLKTQLTNLIVQIKPAGEITIQKKFTVPVSNFKKLLLALPAIIGYILHAPLYIPLQKFAFKKFSKIDHYDSVLTGMLFILYPFYLLLLCLLFWFFFNGFWWLSVLILFPFFAWSFVQVKNQF